MPARALSLPDLIEHKALGRDGIVERVLGSYRGRPAVAIRLVESVARTPGLADKFLDTASDLAALSAELRYEAPAVPHAKVAEVLFHGRDGRGEAGLVIALPQGGRLLSLQDGGGWSAQRALHLGAQLAETLRIAQLRRLHGCALSPSSLFVSGGSQSGERSLHVQLTLLNLGLVQLEAAAAKSSGQRLNGLSDEELGFRAPELRADPQKVGEPAEVFSLGALLQFLMLGPQPESSPTRASVPEEVRGLLTALLDPQPHKRPSLQQVQQRLTEVLSRLSDFEPTESLWEADGSRLQGALQVSTQRTGWLRTLSPKSSTAQRAQLESVAQVLRQNPEPGVAATWEVGEQPDRSPYLFSAGEGTQTLRAYVEKHGPLGRKALGVIESIARTVRSLHRHGVLYLGLGPDNVLIQTSPPAKGSAETEPPLRCWLLQTEHAQSIRKTSDALARTVVDEPLAPPPAGLAPYLAPEQYDEHCTIGERADIYAIGSLLCFLLTGQPPPLRSVELGSDIGVDKLLHDILVKLVNRLRARRSADRPTPDEAVRTLTWLARLDELMNGRLLDGKYRIVRPLAQGGMNALFVVTDAHLNRQAVLKCPFPDLRIAIERARQEAEAATQARRGNSAVVQVLQYGELDTEVPYLLMEMVDGEVLTDRLRRSDAQLPEPEVVQLGLSLAEIMDEVHGNGVIHRDLKPDNIMLEKDRSAPMGVRVRILDFGIARLAAEQYAERRRLTGVGSFMGTPDFMAPEQGFDAAHVTAAADVYSLGVILYFLRGGALPATRPLQRVGSPQLMALLSEMLSFVPASRPSMAGVAVRLRALTQPRSTSRSLVVWLSTAVFLSGAALTAYSALRPSVRPLPASYTDLAAPPLDLSQPVLEGRVPDLSAPIALPDLSRPPDPFRISDPGGGTKGGHSSGKNHASERKQDTPPREPTKQSPKKPCAAPITLRCIQSDGLPDEQKKIIAAKANQSGLQICGKQRLTLTKLNWYVPEPDTDESKRLVALLEAHWTVKNLNTKTMPKTIVISCP